MGVYHGALIDPNWLAEKGTRGRNDEPWEQRAISVGRKHAKTLLKQGGNTLKTRVLEERINYRIK
ncbi:hypothetical protein FAZ19_09725 [Sphingobacterium alkalisoli]|uniref:Uncharacterized protein n=1 Tax=Sphingobacterium alkalisoli TaxID=1874115 RepID=A0A4V5LY73_9SPHI|nr:hypothetical protein [Sphingobacterium alkalisoli]TJY65419.1 hypothetical protein FAZ19_09725 [Sphingobacterium alkalisoli]GGH20574.1 hypothetical protein GCM10011418_25900 [Sphingobacterium alkalisoli]